MATPPDRKLLDKFYRNQCTREEYLHVLAWLQDPANDAQVQQLMHKQWQDVSREQIMQHPDGNDLFDRIQSSIDQSGRMRSLSPFRQIMKVAAVLVFCVLSGALLYSYLNTFGHQTQTTAFGQTRQVTLPDGSIVHLNGNSQVRYAKQWGNNQVREVWLEGEAFFSVTHTATHQPFIVHTPKNVNVEVLGTEFNVYTRREEARVVLSQGKVKLHIASESNPEAIQVEMEPGELVAVTPDIKHYEKKIVDPTLHSSWREHRLQLNNTRLQDLIALLEETYGLRVKVTNPDLLNQRASGTIPTDDQHVLLAVLADVFEISVVNHAEYIEFKPSP